MINHDYRIGIITSKGGHLFEVLQLKSFFGNYDRFWVSFKGKDTLYYLKKERVYSAFFPESRNLLNALKNFFLAFKILGQERPKYLISCGAGIAVPFLIVGKIFVKAKIIYIEPYYFIAYPSLTGRILYNFVDLFLVQHKHQLKWFPKAKFYGSLL